MAAERVLNSRPALEQPITHLKYGVLGALASGIIIAIGVTTLTSALLFWLLGQGMSTAAALLVCGVVLMAASALIWVMANYLGEKRTQPKAVPVRQEVEPDPMDELKAIALSVIKVSAEAFIEGLQTPPENKTDKASADKADPANEVDDPIVSTAGASANLPDERIS